MIFTTTEIRRTIDTLRDLEAGVEKLKNFFLDEPKLEH